MSIKVKSNYFKNNDCDGVGFDIYNSDARIVSDAECVFVSDMWIKSKKSVYSVGDGTYCVSCDNVVDIDNI